MNELVDKDRPFGCRINWKNSFPKSTQQTTGEESMQRLTNACKLVANLIKTEKALSQNN